MSTATRTTPPELEANRNISDNSVIAELRYSGGIDIRKCATPYPYESEFPGTCKTHKDNRTLFMTIIRKSLIAATAAASVLAAGSATAENQIMMGFNPFSGTVSNSSAPSYMVGIRTSDRLMPYGYLSITDSGVQGADTEFALGGGARFYLDNISQNVRPFAGAALGIIDAADTGFSLGAFFGAEAMITESFSVTGQIGAEISDSGCDACDTAIELGTANVMFNLYF